MAELLSGVVSFTVGFIIGLKFARLQKQINDLRDRLTEIDTTPAPGVAMGAYDKVDEYNGVNTGSPIGIVEVKTPQLLSWEEQERNKREVEGV